MWGAVVEGGGSGGAVGEEGRTAGSGMELGWRELRAWEEKGEERGGEGKGGE